MTGLHYISFNHSRYIADIRENRLWLLLEKGRGMMLNNTISYVFPSLADYMDHYGAKPMSINWALRESAPHYIWKDMAKMAVD